MLGVQDESGTEPCPGSLPSTRRPATLKHEDPLVIGTGGGAVPLHGTYFWHPFWQTGRGLAKIGTRIYLEELRRRSHDDLTAKVSRLLFYLESCCGAKRGSTSADAP